METDLKDQTNKGQESRMQPAWENCHNNHFEVSGAVFSSLDRGTGMIVNS